MVLPPALPSSTGSSRPGGFEGYHLLPAARADLNRRLGRAAEAARHYREAIHLAPTGPERRYLERRLAALEG